MRINPLLVISLLTATAGATAGGLATDALKSAAPASVSKAVRAADTAKQPLQGAVPQDAAAGAKGAVSKPSAVVDGSVKAAKDQAKQKTMGSALEMMR